MRALVAAGGAAAVLVTTACGPSASTSGCKDKLIAGDLVLTEVFADAKAPTGGTGTDAGREWFEVYNAADRPLDLKGLTITHSRPDGSKAASHTVEDITIAPGQYMVFGNTTPDLLPPYVDYGYSADLGDLFNTDGGKLVLACKDSEIDSATYEDVKEGHSRELTNQQPPDYTLNDNVLSWCQADDSEFETSNFGTPGSESDCAPVVIGQCSDGGTMRDTVPPQPGDLVITEVMPNPGAVSDTGGEWFEVLANTDVDLNGLGLDRAGDTSNPNVLADPACIHLSSGSYAVFAKSIDTVMNGGLPAASIRGTFTFSLIDGTAAAPGDVRVMSGTNVIDAVTWTSTRSAKSHALDPDFLNTTDNDIESNFCDGATAFGLGDLGTPGSANAQCAGSTAGMCDDAGTLRPIVKPGVGALVITEFLANPANVTGFTDAQREWFEIKNTGATAFDLNELGLARTGGTANVIIAATCKSVPPGGHGLFARSNDPAVNGMLPAVDATFTFSLVDTTGNIEVRDGMTVLDVVTYPSVTSGVTKSLDPDSTTAAGNDTIANFCPGVAGYGDMSNKGTPGADNPQCP